MSLDDELKEIYSQVSGQITREEFDNRIKEKVALMAGLCDPLTAAMLVSKELGGGDACIKIGKIRPESGNVAFVGRIVSISEVREFNRSDGSVGRVANVVFGDETGTIRVVLWDESTELVRSNEIRPEMCLKVKGFARDGRSGTEVSIGRSGGFEEVDSDIRARVEPFKIGEIKRDMTGINLVAMVVDPGEVRSFSRKDGSPGLVRSVVLGDETGKIRLTLWNEQAQMDLAAGESLEVGNAISRERYGLLELQTASASDIKKSDAHVSYSESVVPIDQLAPGNVCNISGFVTGIGELREFAREDGKTGKVANIHVSDDTGRLRVALWGDHASWIERIDLGFKVDIKDALIKSGWNGGLEASCGWRTRITFTPPG
jgi:replication factor A1